MRHLAFRFVRHAPELAGTQFVVDPYLDYRKRLNSNLHESIQKRKSNVDYSLIKDGYFKWWKLFGEYEKDPTKENKSKLVDISSGLINVLKLPNVVIDLNFSARVNQNNSVSLQTCAKNKGEAFEWLSEQIYGHLSKTLPNTIRQSPSYRIRPAFLDACNLPEMDFPRIAEHGIFTSLVGVSLPAQLAPFIKYQFIKQNKYPLNFIAFGASYRQTSSEIKQQFKASILNVNREKVEAVTSFHLIADSISRFLEQLGVDYVVNVVKPEKLSKFEAASVSFNCKDGRSLARISFIGSYISERLNIQLEAETATDINAETETKAETATEIKDDNESPKFAILCHADFNLKKMTENQEHSNVPVEDIKSEEGKAAQKRVHDEDDGDKSEPSNKLMKLPQKRYYRQRAHVNPLSFNAFDNHYHPTDPDNMKWEDFYGSSFNGKTREDVKNLDIGCGYGGLLFKLSPAFPDEFSVGMEIRAKVSKFVQDKITAMRHNEPGQWENICCFRTNTMTYLQNFIAKAQLERIFVLFPDPHFKKKKIKWRIISIPLISQYAYFMKTGGLFYTVTDVLDYHEWILQNFSASELFTKVDDEELKEDRIFPSIFNSSEEGQKVTRNEGAKYHAIYRRTAVESQFVPDFTKKESINGSTAGDNEEESDNEEKAECKNEEI